MEDKLKKLYDLYVQSGIIKTTDFKSFTNANDQQRKKLYDLGKQSGLFQTTDYNTFNNAFNVNAPVKKKSTTGSQSVQKKKPTSSATMPSWMQESLESSAKKEQPVKKNAEQQRQGVYVSKEEVKAPEIKGTGGQYGFTVTPTSKEQKAIKASVGSKVYSGFPGQEENKYRVKNNRWERLYGTNWTEVTNDGSVNALNNYFEKNLNTIKGEIKDDKQDLKRMRSVLRVEEEIASGKKYDEKQFEQRVEYYNTVETQKYLKSKGYDIDVNGIKDDPKTLKALSSSNAKKKIDQGKDFEIEDMRDAVDGIITHKFLMRTEEDAVSVLRKQFGKHGFIFEESGMGTDYVKVTTPGGVEKEFGFDYSNPEIARAEAANMSNFIKKGYMTKGEKKQFEGEDVDMNDRNQRDEYFFDLVNLMGKNPYKYSTNLFSYEEMNNGISRIYSNLKDESKSLEYEYEDIQKRIEQYNANPDDIKEKIAIDKDLYALKKKGFDIKEKYNKLNSTEKNLQKITGLEFAEKEKDGNFLGIITGQLAQGFTNVEKAVLNLSADILPYAIGEDVVDSETRLRLQNEGYTDNQILDYASKQLKRTVVKDITEGITRVATGGSTTKEYISSEDRNDFEKTVSFLSESIGTSLSGGGNPMLQKIAFFTQSYNGMEEQMSSPEFDGLSEWEKKLISVPYGFVIGALERYGFAALGAGKNPVVDRFARGIIGMTMKSLPKDASINTVKREINKSVSRMIGQGALRVVGGAVVEGATEGTQQLAEIAEKNIVNDITDKDYFKDVPDLSTAKGIGEALNIAKEDAYYGFLGGLLYSTVSNSLEVRRDHKFNKKTDEEFKLFYEAMTDTKVVQSNKLQVKLDLKDGKITKEEAKDRISSINDMNAKLKSINSNLSLRDKKDAFNLILEREKLTKEKAPLDEALQAPYNDRITEINSELKVISENAIKASTEQEVTAEGGGVQREGVVEGQPEVGQGEGTVGQATTNEAGLGNRPVEGQKKVTGRTAINRPGILSSFGGKKFDKPLEGDTYVEGQRVMFEEKGTGRVYDLGNVNEMMDNEIDGLTQVEESVVVQPDSKLSVDGNNWNIQMDLPTMGIEYNPAGEVTRVSLKDDNGNTTMFDGQKAVDIAYQIELQKIQSPEQQQLINDLLEQDEEFKAATADIELTEATDVVQEKAVTDTKPTAKPTVTAAAAPKITETTDTKSYSEALSSAKAELKEEGNGLDLQVSDVSQEEADQIVAEGGKIFMTEDGLAGAYVKKDGYMGGLFKSPKATYKEVAKLLQQARIKVGGKFMDAYATELERIYVKNGFRPIARMKFNEEYAPEGWDAPGSALAGKPDVVFFAYDPDGKYKIGDGEYVEDYDAAYEMAKNFDSKVLNEADKLAELMKGSTVVEGTNEQVDALIKEISDSDIVVAERTILEQVANATKALKSILPNVKFVLHSTNESYKKAVGDSSRGAYDLKNKVIHINLTKANNRTVMHEVFHAIIISKVSSDAKLQSLTKNMVKSVMKSLKQSGANQNVITYLEEFSAGYEVEEQNEEKLSELFALLGETYKMLDYPTQNIIQRFLDRVAKMFGLKEMTDREVVDFMNSLSGQVEAGKEITEKEFRKSNGEPGSIVAGTIINKKQKPFIDESFNTSIEYDDTNLPDKIKMPSKSTMDEVLSKSGGAAIFINSDGTKVGVRRNGDPLHGGWRYTYLVENQDANIGFAATSTAHVGMMHKMATSLANLRDYKTTENSGKPIAVFVTIQNAETMLGEWYAGEFFMEGIDEAISKNKFKGGLKKAKALLLDALNYTNQIKELKSKIKNLELERSNNTDSNVILEINSKIGKISSQIESKLKAANDPANKKFVDLIKSNKFDTHEGRIEISQDLASKRFSFGYRVNLLKQLIPLKSATGSNREIKAALLDVNYGRKDLYEEHMDEVLLEKLKSTEYEESSIGGVTMGGFYLDPYISEEQFMNNRVNGIEHAQFNESFSSNGESFVLDGAIRVNDFAPEMGYPTNEGYKLYNEKNDSSFNKSNITLEDRLKIAEFLSKETNNDSKYLTPPFTSIGGSMYTPIRKQKPQVGETVEVYGSSAKVTAVDGDMITFEGKDISGDIDYKTSSDSILNEPTPKAQIEEEVKTLEEEMKPNTDKPKFRKQIVGENANLAQNVRDNLDVARQMEADKKSKKDVRIATGWERGADKKWRYEIDDNIFILKGKLLNIYEEISSNEKLKNSVNKFNAKDILDKEVLKLYPVLSDLIINIDPKINKGTGSYNKSLNEISIPLDSNLSVNSSVLIHELQHAIQHIENFAIGTSSSKSSNIVVADLVDEIYDGDDALTYNKLLDILSYIDKNSSDSVKMKSGMDRLKKLLDKYSLKKYGKTINESAFKIYKAYVGEVESRNVEKRMNMSPEQRRQTTLEETEDVSREDQIIFFEDSKFRKQKASKQAAVIVKKGKEANLSDAGIREYMKRNGYTDRQATDAIRAYNDKKEGIFIDPEWSKLRKAAVIFKRRFLLSRGLMPSSAFASYEESQANTAKGFNRAEKTLVDFNRAMRKVPKADRDKVRIDFDEYVRGDNTVSLPADLKKVADTMRAHIDSISISLINSGVVDEHLAQKIKDNLGSYFTRSYKVHDRANWKNEVEEDIKQKAINLLKVQYRKMAEEEAAKENMDVEEALDNLVTNAINDMLTKSGAENFVSGGKKGSKDLSILKERQDIPLEIRMLMGEYTDPAQNYARTILKMSALAANHHFLTEVKKNGTGVFLFEKNDPRRPKEFSYKIAAEGSETMNPLNGMYTTEEIGKQFEEQSSQLKGVLKWMLETYMKALSSVKWGKTIGSIMTHAKNIFGNLGFVVVNGHWRVNEMAKAYQTVRRDLWSTDNEKSREYMNHLIGLGIVKQSAGIGELRAMFKDADWDTAMVERLNKKSSSVLEFIKYKIGGRVKKFLEDRYQAEDDFFKIVAYENELSRYSKAMFGKRKTELTEEEKAEVDKVVAEIVKNTYPTYSRIPEIVNFIRKFPFVGNFIAFQAESYRTAFNTAALSLDEVKSKNPGIRQIGAQRLVGSLTYMAGKTAILSAFSNAVGMGAVGILGYFTDDDDEKQKENDVRKFIAPWSKNSDLIVLKASNGKIQYIDFSSSDPHGGINKAINSALIGENTVDGFINAIGSVIEPFIGEEMTTAAILAVKNNQDAYGRPIYNPEDTFDEKAKDISKYMLNVVQPGTVSSARKMYESDSKLNEAVGAATGMRIYDVDVADNFKYSMITYKNRMEDAKRIYNSEVYNKDATDKSIASAKKRAEKAITRINEEIYERYYAAVRLGANDDILVEHMKTFGRISLTDMKFMFGQVPYLLREKAAPEEE